MQSACRGGVALSCPNCDVTVALKPLERQAAGRLLVRSCIEGRGQQKKAGELSLPRLLFPETLAYCGALIVSLPIVRMWKSSRRFCDQQDSSCSLQVGRSSP